MIVSTGADIDQINSNLLHLCTKDLALLDTPGDPVPLFVPFVSCPFCPADSDEERLVRPRLADLLDQSKRPVHAVLQAWTAVIIGPVI